MRLIYFIIIFTIISCNDHKKTLPNSTGSNSEILFVAPDYLWDEKIKDYVFNIFCQDIPGISKSESSFKVLQINNQELTSLLRTHTNIILLSNDSVTSFTNNLWANNQLVTHLSFIGNLRQFQLDCNNAYNAYYDKEIINIRNNIIANSNKKYSVEILKNYGIDIVIPSKYNYIKDTSDAMIFSYNPENKDEIKHIIIYRLLEKNLDERIIIEETNQVLSQGLIGPTSNTHVIIEERFPFEMYNNSYRGLWKLNKGFMGGSILIKPFFTDNDVVLVCAIVFDPGNPKRNHIKEFESIL